jgi:biopolymer transport protein ExbB
MTLDGATTTTYTRDTLGRLTGLDDTALPQPLAFGYSAAGRLNGIVRPNGVNSALTYQDGYLAGKTDDVPVDMSGGATLRQLTRRNSFGENMRAGGPIMWPLGLIALAALIIAIYKIVYMNRLHGNTDRIMSRVTELAERGNWSGCESVLDEHAGKNWPVIQVIRAGLAARNQDRGTLETVLQEAILHELPRIQKGIAIFAVLGAVAPLLGLLGTVTGMIETFRVITLFGNSDPKLMSGGISEALITTEVGLTVAIPIMLVHTYIARRSDHLIGDMEEKAVQLTNIIQKRAALDGLPVTQAVLP